MSVRSQVLEAIKSLPADEDGWVQTTNQALADLTGFSTETISKNVFSLRQSGVVDTQATDTGSMIRVLRDMGHRASYERRKRAPTSPALRNGISTPLLDEYAKAKAEYERLSASEVGRWVEVGWKGDPLAEEGLALKNKVEAIMPRLREVTAKLEEAERDLAYFRRSNDAEFRKTLQNAGVMVQHSE